MTGNLDLITIKSSLKINRDINNVNSNTFFQYAFNNTFNNVIQNDFFGYEIVSLWKTKRIHPKFAGMYEKSKVRSFENHYVVGLGLGWNVVSKKKHKLEVMSTFSYEKKEFIINETLDYGGGRLSFIIKGEDVLFQDKLILKHNFFLNPFLTNANNNYRYRILIDLLMPLSRKLSAKVSFDYSNESIIDTGFQPINTVTTFGISLKL